MLWQYVLLFLLAAAPWLDVFVVVPLGIAWGLHPVAVSITAFAGNWLIIVVIAVFFERLSLWLRRRRARKKGISLEEADIAAGNKAGRAKRLWEKFGIPGLALLAPVVVGTDLAVLFALLFGSSRKYVVLWMTVSLVAWTIALAVSTYYGLDLLGWSNPLRA